MTRYSFLPIALQTTIRVQSVVNTHSVADRSDNMCVDDALDANGDLERYEKKTIWLIDIVNGVCRHIVKKNKKKRRNDAAALPRE